MTAPATDKPVLIYDGECGICYEWVRYWDALTANTIRFRPYQEAAADYPAITTDEFKRAIQWIAADGTVLSGAAATFKLYATVPPYAVLLWLYRYLPGFAWISEFCYRFFSGHRGLLSAITHLFWGRDFMPPRHDLTAWLFLRLLGGIYFAAFASFGVQVLGLIGSNGIAPLDLFLNYAQTQLGRDAYWQVPNLFWLYLSDHFLQFVCVLGALLSLSVVLNFFTTPALILLYCLYLSLFHAGQTFMTFQWDLLLLEAGFLAIFLGIRSRSIVWLFRWLVFRFMLLGGIVKIVSADPGWDSLTALYYHFETQPLPTPLAWYAHNLPHWSLQGATGVTLLIELLVPFLIFSPRRFRIGAAGIFMAFQSLIALTGNYNFFNLLTMALCLFLLDDACIRKFLPALLCDKVAGRTILPHKASRLLLAPLAAIILFASGEQLIKVMDREMYPEWSFLNRILYPLHIINGYGPFAVMTTERFEIVIEGTRDGQTWHEYEFNYKPGAPARRPRFNLPHQPRLDWQMWFAALNSAGQNPWFRNLLIRLLQNKPDVIALFLNPPFPDSPPLAVRARLYRYEFTSPDEKRASGHWWKRTPAGEYYRPIQLPP